MPGYPEIHNIDDSVVILRAIDNKLDIEALEITVMFYPVIKDHMFEIPEEQLIWEIRNGKSIYN